jgi:phosphate uptake regulator
MDERNPCFVVEFYKDRENYVGSSSKERDHEVRKAFRRIVRSGIEYLKSEAQCENVWFFSRQIFGIFLVHFCVLKILNVSVFS